MVIGAVAALIWVGAATADPGISIFRGGRVGSPDGRWTLKVHAADLDAGQMSAPVWLIGPKGYRRRLMAAERYVTVRWLPVIGKLVLLEQTIHFNRIAVFTLGARDTYRPDRIEKQIEADLRRHGRSLQTVENRTIVFGREGGSCVLVEESGLPPGKAEGSFLTRRAAYRIDFSSGSVQRIARCPGASIE
jgi:hypothetical protein